MKEETNVRLLPTERLLPNPNQPRKHFDSEGLLELAQSIRENGVLQPLLVRRINNSDYYEIVTGERRLRALLGEHDDYLEVFDDNMQYSEAPVVNAISEKLADIYQDLRNFIAAYRGGMTEVIEEALWQLNSNFELYWGKACASVLRAIHGAIYKIADNPQMN